MPHFTLTIGSDGPTVDLVVAVGRAWHRRLAAQGTSVPSPTTVRALIDTGSDLSVVHPQVLQQLGVQATGSVRIRRPGAGRGFRLPTMFETEPSIGGVGHGALWISTRVVGVAPSTPTVLALIGRDVLEHCTLFYGAGTERETRAAVRFLKITQVEARPAAISTERRSTSRGLSDYSG